MTGRWLQTHRAWGSGRTIKGIAHFFQWGSSSVEAACGYRPHAQTRLRSAPLYVQVCPRCAKKVQPDSERLPEDHPLVQAVRRVAENPPGEPFKLPDWQERIARRVIDGPKPFLVTDSIERAEAVLRMNGRNLREFHVIHREDGLMGIEGDVYTLNTGVRYSAATWDLWSRFHQRAMDGRLNDLGVPPARARA